MVPFLFDGVANLVHVLMKRFVKKSILYGAGSVTKLVKFDVSNKETRCTYKEVDDIVGSTKALSLVKISDSERMSFRMDCAILVICCCQKLVLGAVFYRTETSGFVSVKTTVFRCFFFHVNPLTARHFFFTLSFGAGQIFSFLIPGAG